MRVGFFFYTGVGRSRFALVRMETDMQVMMVTIALLTQKNITMARGTHSCKPSFASPCVSHAFVSVPLFYASHSDLTILTKVYLISLHQIPSFLVN